MERIQLKTRVEADGILKLEIPLEVRETDLEVMVVIEPLASDDEISSPEGLGWPRGFFEKIAGAWQGEPLQRPEQGEYETRDALR